MNILLRNFTTQIIHMAGIYIHIPFCRQACHYCDFHFSTSLKTKDDLVKALMKEAFLQKEFFSGLLKNGKELTTLYFGGGTPSLLSGDELTILLETLHKHFHVSPSAEITLEANPDDLNSEKLRGLMNAGINRLSIGIQSFFDEDLKFMNRAHNASQAEASVKRAQDTGISNISIDLIYGTPTLDNDRWKKNLATAFELQVPHLSCYALTVEEKTALSHFIRIGKTVAPDDQQATEQFSILMDQAEKNGFVHYEISNFAKEGFNSRHNSNYWKGEPYLGLGPGAHSYNVNSRQWNVANNPQYIKNIQQAIIPCEREELSTTQRYNEYVMISLRTKEGIDLAKVESDFGRDYTSHLKSELQKIGKADLLISAENHIVLTNRGKHFADRLAADLFIS
jgi:oxygen-independent coproporphyrinogen III oxidase